MQIYAAKQIEDSFDNYTFFQIKSKNNLVFPQKKMFLYKTSYLRGFFVSYTGVMYKFASNFNIHMKNMLHNRLKTPIDKKE